MQKMALNHNIINQIILIALFMISCQRASSVVSDGQNVNNAKIHKLYISNYQNYVDMGQRGFDSKLCDDIKRNNDCFKVAGGQIIDFRLFRSLYPYIKDVGYKSNRSVCLVSYMSTSIDNALTTDIMKDKEVKKISEYDSLSDSYLIRIWGQDIRYIFYEDNPDNWAIIKYNSYYLFLPKTLDGIMFKIDGYYLIYHKKSAEHWANHREGGRSMVLNVNVDQIECISEK